MKVIPERVTEWAHNRYIVNGRGCHVSTYATASHGYAHISWYENGGRDGTTAHRASWTFVHGQIPEGMTVDHKGTCSKKCVNVAHLRLLSNFENSRRTHGRDWPLGTCVNGHSDDLRRTYPSGTTYCPECRSDSARRRRERVRKEAA